MMSNKNNGGPAFPISNPELCSHNNVEGMSLRDYFAAKAMQGFISAKNYEDFSFMEISKDCYLIADAMIEARNEN